MAWTPPSKLIVTLTFLLVAVGLFILVELFFGLTGILPALNIGTFTSDQWWGIIGMTLVFLSWFLFYLGVIMKGL
jgi:hypothetical protein